MLDNFLYEAIFIPDGIEAPPREIIDQPELKIYTDNFGKQNDTFALLQRLIIK